ncbi:hypothetical protein N2W54_006207 [Lotmaria passim]
MTSRDASVTALMDRMSDIDKQRRVLSMRQKELEAKMAFATAEKDDLEREAKAMADEEAQLKVDLEALAAEEQRLELQTVEVTDHLRRTEEEEAVHAAAAHTELQSLANERTSWQEKAAELEALRQTWENDPATSACIAGLRNEVALQNQSKALRLALEQQKIELESVVEKLRAAQQAKLAGTGVCAAVTLPSLRVQDDDGPSSADAASTEADTAHNTRETPAQNVEEEMKKAAYEWAQVAARHTWTMSSLQREVDALSTRAAELQDLLTNVQAARNEVAQRAARLQQCLASGRCSRCASP